jgi:hypothetical protein
MYCWMPFLVALVALLVLPLIFIIGAGIVAFFIAINVGYHHLYRPSVRTFATTALLYLSKRCKVC